MKITTLAQLAKAAKERKSIITRSRSMPCPAAWAMNWLGTDILRHLQSGMWIYHRKIILKSRKPYYTPEQTMQILQRMMVLECCCGQRPTVLSSGWNWFYLVCLNPNCARKPSVSGLGKVYLQEGIEPIELRFRQASARKLLTFTKL